VGVNQSEIGYLDEGLTELSTALYLSNFGGDAYETYIDKAKKSYLNIRESLIYLGNTLPPVMERNLKDFSTASEYVMIAYNRSEIMFDDIKRELGDEKFFKFVKKFIKDNAYKNVTAKDFEKALLKKSKSAVKIFKEYVSGEKMIKIADI
jgi:aminopeptidase N